MRTLDPGLAPRWGAAAGAAAATALCLSGCSSLWSDDANVRTVSVAEFSQPAPAGMILGAPPLAGSSGAAGHGTTTDEADLDGDGTTESGGAGATGAATGVSTAPRPAGQATSGATTATGAAPATTSGGTAKPTTGVPAEVKDGDVWIVDALVGQINGRPVFAQEFLDPIEAKLVELANAPDRVAGWRQAQAILDARFEDFVNSELIISEAESQLTPEQQQGFFGWVKSLQEGTIAEYSESREEARERMRDELGMDIEEYIQQRRDASLVQYLLDKKVKPRTIVAWRDIEREYLVREKQFNPPPMVVIGRLALNAKSDAEKVAQVKGWFGAGKTFKEVAASLALEKGGTLVEIPVKPGEDAAAAIAGSEDLTPAAKANLKGVEPGRPGAAIERGDSVTWLAISEVKQDPPRSLYDPDVQVQLRKELNAVRGAFERGRYISRLRSRWVSDDIERISGRLKEIALERYWKQ